MLEDLSIRFMSYLPMPLSRIGFRVTTLANCTSSERVPINVTQNTPKIQRCRYVNKYKQYILMLGLPK